jgi:hypothetical protein
MNRFTFVARRLTTGAVAGLCVALAGCNAQGHETKQASGWSRVAPSTLAEVANALTYPASTAISVTFESVDPKAADEAARLIAKVAKSLTVSGAVTATTGSTTKTLPLTPFPATSSGKTTTGHKVTSGPLQLTTAKELDAFASALNKLAPPDKATLAWTVTKVEQQRVQ